jgi:hypothetical protein
LPIRLQFTNRPHSIEDIVAVMVPAADAQVARTLWARRMVPKHFRILQSAQEFDLAELR